MDYSRQLTAYGCAKHDYSLVAICIGTRMQANHIDPSTGFLDRGVDAIQGYIHVCPIPEETFSDWFQHRRAP